MIRQAHYMPGNTIKVDVLTDVNLFQINIY
jgi:hypothetical protein